MTCTFFGHSSFTKNIYEQVRNEILQLIDSGVTSFYVGNNGQFDYTVQKVLESISLKRSNFKYFIVLSRLSEAPLNGATSKTLFPEELECAMPRFAISKRNEWLISHSDIAICFVTHTFSNSHKWLEKSQRKGLKIINLSSL